MSEHSWRPIRLAGTLGVLVAFGVFLLVAFIAPDEGSTPTSWRQGLALLVVFAAPAVAALLTPDQAAAMGGAMFVTGAVTMMGGATHMTLMAAAGFLLLLAATTRSEHMTTGIWIRFALVTPALVTGIYLAHGTSIVTGLGALALATLVVLIGTSNTRATRRSSVGT